MEKKMAVITTMFALVKTFGKCCHNYLKEIEIISKSCSNPIVDAFVDNFLNNFYLKFHILIPKDKLNRKQKRFCKTSASRSI